LINVAEKFQLIFHELLKRSRAVVRAGPSRCGAQCKTWAWAPLSSDFVTSSCSVNRVTIVVERRYTVKH